MRPAMGRILLFRRTYSFMKKIRFFSFNPPEKGVQKKQERATARTDFAGFFTMYGRKFWNISNVNLIMAVYFVIFILGMWQLPGVPVVFPIFCVLMALLFGLMMTGVTYVLRGYVRGDPVYILSDFFYALKKNWLQGMLLGLIDLLITFLLLYDIYYWSGIDVARVIEEALRNDETVTEMTDAEVTDALAEENAVIVSETAEDSGEEAEAPKELRDTMPVFLRSVCFYGSIFLFIIYQFMRYYMYLLLVTFKISLFKVLKNSFIFAFAGAARNALAAVGIFVITVINLLLFAYITPVGVALPMIITVSTGLFMATYAAYPVVKKHMITPFYKDEEIDEQYDRIFEDRG